MLTVGLEMSNMSQMALKHFQCIDMVSIGSGNHHNESLDLRIMLMRGPCRSFLPEPRALVPQVLHEAGYVHHVPVVHVALRCGVDDLVGDLHVGILVVVPRVVQNGVVVQTTCQILTLTSDSFQSPWHSKKYLGRSRERRIPATEILSNISSIFFPCMFQRLLTVRHFVNSLPYLHASSLFHFINDKYDFSKFRF